MAGKLATFLLTDSSVDGTTQPLSNFLKPSRRIKDIASRSFPKVYRGFRNGNSKENCALRCLGRAGNFGQSMRLGLVIL